MDELYATNLDIYNKMRDVFQGEMHMKIRALQQSKGMFDQSNQLKAITKFDQYLRPTDGMRRNQIHGYQRWTDYIFRSKFYPFPTEQHDQSLGMIENEPPVIQLPAQLEFMRKDATDKHESLEKVLSITNSEQLKVSRIGLFLQTLELTSLNSNTFDVSFYKAESIVDLNEKMIMGQKEFDWVKLLTCEVVREKPVYLILYIAQDGFYSEYKTTNSDAEYGVYGEADDGYIFNSYSAPNVREKPSQVIPFVITNVQRLGSRRERPFLESTADASIKLFQASATYEDSLYWGGQSTLFTQGYGGKDNPVMVGNGAVNCANNNTDNVYSEYVTAGIEGIEPSKVNVADLKADCIALGVDLVNQGVESGTALDTRLNVKTASLKTLAKTGAEGLQRLLRIGAEWIGAVADEVVITANTSFSDTQYTLTELRDAHMGGYLLKEDLYNIMKKQELTSVATFEEWNALYEAQDVEVTVL